MEKAQRKQAGSDASFVRGVAAGLVAGMLASFVMDRFQAAIASLSSSDRDSEPATDKTADAVSRMVTGRELAKPDKPFGGQLVHYGLGAGLGLLYGVAAEYRPCVTTGAGAAFGIGVAAVLDDAIVPAMGLAEPLWKSGIKANLYALTSHLVFGATAEWTRKQVRSTLT